MTYSLYIALSHTLLGVILKWRFWYTHTFATVATKGSRVGEGLRARRVDGCARESALRLRR